MKAYWKYVVLIFIFLAVQAWCDLALPDYTSKIIDTGIQNSGVEHILPEKITEDEYQLAQVFMTEDEKNTWQDCYESSGDIYELKDMKDSELDDMDELFSTAVFLDYQMSSVEESAYREQLSAQLDGSGIDISSMTIEEIGQMMGVEFEVTQKTDDDGNILNYIDTRPLFALNQQTGKMTEDDILSIREQIQDTIDTMGSSVLKSMEISYAIECDEKAGVDLDKVQKNYLFESGLKMLVVALILTLCSVVASFLASRVGSGVGRDLRRKVFTNVVGFSNSEIDKFSTASLITRSTNDIQQIQMVTVMLLRMICYAPILGIGGIVKVVSTKAGMGWIIVLAVAAIICLVAVLMSVALPKFKMMQNLVDRVNLVSREILTGLPVIRAFGREKTEEERFDKANKQLTGTMLFTNRVMTFMMPGMQFIMYGLTVLIVWVAAHRIDNGAMQVGAMTAFMTYAMMIVMSFLMLTVHAIMLPRAGVAANRVQEVITTKSSITDSENAKEMKKEKASVEFRNVSFSYSNTDENVLSDISFTAKSGETTAIIGGTGSGKSTLVNLIPRLYDVSKGQILYNGVDIREIRMKDLRENIGYVPQKGILFSGTIADNLRFGNRNASMSEVKEAADIAQASEFIEEKNNKYDSFIAQGGSNVSGGQKQRLSIARAIAKNPDIYIFDDSFSALDLKTDAKLRKALSKKTKNAAVIIVAQRISTIKNAEQIIVLDDGKIVGKGTHDELMKNCEVYMQIAKSQYSAKELGLEQGKEEL
jgi:ATP-binding cassette subfamily B protein